MSYWIKCTSLMSKEYEGEFNGKYYDSKIPMGKYNFNTYRVFINNKEVIINDNEKINIETQIKIINEMENNNEYHNQKKKKIIFDLLKIIFDLTENQGFEFLNKCIDLYNSNYNKTENKKNIGNSRFEVLETWKNI